MWIQCYMGQGLQEACTTARRETDANFQQKHLFLPAQEKLLAENSELGFFCCCYKNAKKHTTEKSTNAERLQTILHAFLEEGT